MVLASEGLSVSLGADSFPVEHDPVFGCRLWRGKVDRHGYPVIWRGKRPSAAHRVMYEAELGAIAPGLELDHECRRPLCVATHHLRPVTRSENEKLKSWRYRLLRTHCKNGHEMKLAIVTPEGGRVCRTCNLEART